MGNTASTTSMPPQLPGFGEPVWGLAELFPAQGCWSEREYLNLDTNRRVELSDGYLEVQPLPTTTHHLVLLYLFDMLRQFVGAQGLVIFAGIRVRLRSGLVREPDVVFMAKEHSSRIGNKF